MVVDGGAGSVALEPGRERRRSAELAAGMRQRARERSAAARELPSETLDGHSVRVLTNVASAAIVVITMPLPKEPSEAHLAGLVAQKAFDRLWAIFDDEEPHAGTSIQNVAPWPGRLSSTV